jgi:hypothetical protein
LCDYLFEFNFVKTISIRNVQTFSLIINECFCLCVQCICVLELFHLLFCASRFLLPVAVLTRYDTLVETVYSSFESAILGFCGAATRFDFDDPKASGSSDFDLAFGSLDGSGSDLGSLEGSGSDLGSLDGSGSDLGSLDGSDLGSLDGSSSDFGSLDGSGSDLGSLEGSGSLDGSGAAAPSSCKSGNFLHSAVNFFGLHPKPTHEVPFTTKAISISFCSFRILQ